MTNHVRLTQIDGKLPNLALMRLAAYHIFRGRRRSGVRNATIKTAGWHGGEDP